MKPDESPNLRLISWREGLSVRLLPASRNPHAGFARRDGARFEYGRTMRYLNRLLTPSLVLVVMLFAPRLAHAQGIGLQGGFTYDTVSGEGLLDDIQGKSGWLVGLWYGGSAPVTFMGEISYVVREAEDQSGRDQLKRTFIEFPTLLRINLGSRNYRVYPMGGPVFDIQLTAEDANGNNVKDSVNSYDIGLLVGAGLQISRFAIEGRYIWGLTDILSNNVSFIQDLGLNDSKNRSFQLVVKVKLN